MSSDTVVSVENVSKKFSRTLRHVMMYGAADIARNMLGLSSRPQVLRNGEFWAVDDVSFELGKGETLGLIGPNGSGKSTLLKMLNGIYMPDRGRIRVKGRVGALIEVGAGFHPMLTGRENVYINGAILGMSKAEIDKKFDSIVEFADVGEFINAPVKHYSSGMFVRLGFAVAIHSEPDLLLVDEVLAVGDANFQKKCFDRILDIKKSGASIIFVSHSVSAVERLCNRTVLVKNGKMIFHGSTREAIQKYFHESSQNNLDKVQSQTFGTGEVIFSDIFAYQDGGNKHNANIEFGQDIIIEFNYRFLKKRNQNNQIRLGIRTFDGRDVQKIFFHEGSFPDGLVYPNEKIVSLGDQGTCRIKILNPRLFPQTYILDIAIAPLDMDVHLGGISNAKAFNIVCLNDERRYFEYGNATVTDFDFDVEVFKRLQSTPTTGEPSRGLS
ncbi:MAG: polysaccharide ABC transporter ATP-binding protein [Actinomycetota bacterium]|nr:polysaccharide ABC transporter ATP-binding protein [Actinomycetota bacterium]